VRRVRSIFRWLSMGSAISLVALATGCNPPQSTPPPPPPPQVVIPPQPRPPLGAPTGMRIPPINASGVRQTINTGVSQDQLLWNFRSAYNVAALDCLATQHAAILENYKAFLLTYSKALGVANKGVDQQFGVAKGRENVRAREAYMTQVYNFYALPPTLPAFCDAALAMSNDLAAISPAAPAPAAPTKGRGKAPVKAAPQGSEATLRAFVATNQPKLDQVFLDFFNSYDQYRTDLAAWQARYAPVINTNTGGVPASSGPMAGPPMSTTTGSSTKP
jgi:hypothetical protein